MKFVLAGKDGTLEEVAISDVLMIKLTSKGPLFYTTSGEYSYAMTRSALLPSLQAMGFESLDRNNIVNTAYIHHYNEEFREVHLGADQEQAIRASVSTSSTRKLPDHLRERSECYFYSVTA
ncbi:LytTR family transcriptional regulator DNA-binding domain-containing protein [Paenibacillus daejeonensis]|uniref:LytTR family transcriptional regulator DNA-binding domain-containing protein n=1 Tax=Paenibacillus daejeonensis TaxID=135193 RepID=UPI0003623EAF|nr:LytTR family transcriptional regulator DNA-binding domain-containing protein [Paenibacillus daejeonensis]